MTGPAAQSQRGERVVQTLFQLGFWVPLAVCTYLALVPRLPDTPLFQVSDIGLHAVAFTYLSFALLLAQSARGNGELVPSLVEGRPRPEHYFSTFGLMLAYGVFIELVQAFVPERAAEMKDLLVDVAGIAFGLLLGRFLVQPLRRLALRLTARL
ncbi:MAG: VanZ family protein [Pseudomonadota bacterium]